MTLRYADKLTIETLRSAAKRRLPNFVFDVLDGGSESETTLRRNREAFDAVELVPRMPRDVSVRDIEADILGKPSSMPLAIAPTAMCSSFWPRGEICLAQAAKEAGIPFSLSTAASTSIEDVAAVGGRLWFQLYQYRNAPEVTRGLLERAERAGYEALILTLDVPMQSNRERDRRNRVSNPLRLNPSLVWEGVVHPRWGMQILRHGIPTTVNLSGRVGVDSAVTWDSLARLRDLWPRRMLVKGILAPEDARMAGERGYDGIIVSNHGGRQLDGAPATIAALPRIVDAVAGRIEVLVDSGFRRGTDVLKALSLGASAAMIGRPTLYGLGAGGQEGAAGALRIFRDEIQTSMALCGGNNLAEYRSLNIARPTPDFG
jgi:isopentenyl diphosphate isomerase/L-lactate dehydrogenase-like FMN-dependent dehydrogenase